MAIKKPPEIPEFKDTSAKDPINEIKEGIVEFGMKSLDKNDIKYLSQTEPYFPVVSVKDKHHLIAVSTKRFRGLVWLCSWFEVESAYRDKNNVYRVRLRINDRIVEVDYDTLYPKDITKLSRYGLIVNFDYAESLSRYIFRMIAKLEVKEQFNGMGFMMQDGQLTFRAYDEEPQILQYTEGITLPEYVENLNGLLTNTAVMFALCCSCASLFLAYLSMKCSIALQSFIISFYGKSTSQALMTSVFTKPDDKKIYIPFFGTLNAIVRNLSQKYGIPQLFDEATVSSGLNMENLLYTITLEQDKSRCRSNAILEKSDTWKLIAITSSENRLLADNRMHNKGLDARLLSFELKFTDSREHSDRIHEFCGKNYGILGGALSEYLLGSVPGKIAEIYEECKEFMRNAIDDEFHFDLTERLVNEYELILMSARILSDFGVNMDTEGIRAILTANHNETRERTDIADKYYQHLVAYAVTHPYMEGIKKDEANNSVAFVDELFMKILENHGASNPDLVIRELDAGGYIFRRKKNSIKNRLRFNGTLVSCYEIVLPKDDSESDDGCMTLEYVLTHFEGLDE
ncbi:MAG: DUF927 domain-containing protein [Porcipelethomonas sp.]